MMAMLISQCSAYWFGLCRRFYSWHYVCTMSLIGFYSFRFQKFYCHGELYWLKKQTCELFIWKLFLLNEMLRSGIRFTKWTCWSFRSIALDMISCLLFTHTRDGFRYGWWPRQNGEIKVIIVKLRIIVE